MFLTTPISFGTFVFLKNQSCKRRCARCLPRNRLEIGVPTFVLYRAWQMFDSTRGPAEIAFIRYVRKIMKSTFLDLFEPSLESPQAENLGSIPGAGIILV